MTNILITSAGKRIDLIKAFKKALGKNGKIIITDASEMNAGRFFADKFYKAPRLTDKNYLNFLKKIIRQNRIKLVFTVIDTELPILAKHKLDLEANGCQIMVSPLESVEITNDKRQSSMFLSNIGITTPEILTAKIRKFPVFIKPADGSRSLHAHKINDIEELNFYQKRVPNGLILEFIPGQEYTIDALCDFQGQVLNIIPRKRIEVRDGIAVKTIVDLNPKIIAAVKKILRNIKVIGPATLQCIKNSKGIFFTDINLRFGGAAMLGIASGGRYPEKILNLLKGKEYRFDNSQIKNQYVMISHQEHSFYQND